MAEKKNLKVAIVHDWLVAYAGADRVVDQMHQVFPEAPIYTLVYDRNNMPERFKSYDIRTTWVQKIPRAVKLYKNFLTLMPGAFEALDLSEFDLVISSSSCCSKGIITRPDAVHICYCHTPIRYVWDFYYTYLNNAGWLKRKLMPGMIHKMRIWDRAAADRVDYFVANSRYISGRIKKYYRRDSDVIYPCVHIPTYTLEQLAEKPRDYYFCVSRFTWYKRLDLAVEACTCLGKRLIVAGRGEEEQKLRALAGPTVEFVGAVSDEEIQAYYLGAKAFLFPGEEDFGITPVEAQAAGTPVLAYGKGGALETVKDGQTGLFFAEQTVEAVAACIERFEAKGVGCGAEEIRRHSESFSEERFRAELEKFCMDKYDEWQDELKNCVREH